MTLAGFQKRHLRGLAHHLKPVAHVGQGGITPSVCEGIGEALDARELIKVKLVQFTERRKTFAAELAEAVEADLVGLIGNVAILYREHPDPARREVEVPQR